MQSRRGCAYIIQKYDKCRYQRVIRKRFFCHGPIFCPSRRHGVRQMGHISGESRQQGFSRRLGKFFLR